MSELKITLDDTALGIWTFTDEQLQTLVTHLTVAQRPGPRIVNEVAITPQQALVAWAARFVDEALNGIQQRQATAAAQEARSHVAKLDIGATPIDVDAVATVITGKVSGVDAKPVEVSPSPVGPVGPRP